MGAAASVEMGRPEQWSVDKVVEYLTYREMGVHAETAKTRRLDGRALMNAVASTADLAMLGIVDPAHVATLQTDLRTLPDPPSAEEVEAELPSTGTVCPACSSACAEPTHGACGECPTVDLDRMRAAPAPSTGLALLGGQFEVQHEVGATAHGQLWMVSDSETGDDVLAKILQVQEASAQQVLRSLQRLQLEARLSSQFKHPGLSEVLRWAQDPETGLVFAVLPLIEGQSLREMLDDEGPMDQDSAVAICLDLLVAIEALHDAGIAHCAVCPENVMIPLSGPAVLIDLGNARQISPGGDDAVGQKDVFAIGVLLHEMTVGRRPFEGETPPETMPDGDEWHWPKEELEEVCIPGIVAAVVRACDATGMRQLRSAAQLRQALEHPTDDDTLVGLTPHEAQALRLCRAAVTSRSDDTTQELLDDLAAEPMPRLSVLCINAAGALRARLVEVLCEALRRDYLCNLTQLDLSMCTLGDDGVAGLARAMQGNVALLQKLKLTANGITAEGVRVLAEGLGACEDLQTLSLHANRLGPEGGQYMARGLARLPELLELNLTSTGLEDEGTAHLAGALQRVPLLETLQLEDNRIGVVGAAALADGLAHLKALKHLDVSNNPLGDAGSAALSPGMMHLTALEKLCLRSAEIGDEGAAAVGEALVRMRKLKDLNLSYNVIGDEGGKMLQAASSNHQALARGKVDIEGNRISAGCAIS